MKIPKKIIIGGHIIKVDCSKELKDVNGESVFSENRINICKTLPQSQKEATLIHEIFHFLNSTFGDTDSFISHCLLDSLSEQMYQVLAQNKFLK